MRCLICLYAISCQVNTVQLIPEDLCNQHGDWNNINRVMVDWERTNSPVAYWAREMSEQNYKQRRFSLKLDRKTMQKATNMSYGLPTEEALRVSRLKTFHY